MKNVILASMLVLGVSAFANDEKAPAAGATATTPAATEAAPAPEAAKKAAKHAGHTKKADKKKVEAGK